MIEMNEIEAMRRRINREQSALRSVLTSPGMHGKVIERFLAHHAMLHSARVSDIGVWSYEDALLNDLPEKDYRVIPSGGEHSIAWAIWHIARIEDAAMNLLVAGTRQVLLTDSWTERLGVEDRDSGNELGLGAIEAFSRKVDPAVLRGYRAAVGRRTRDIVRALQPEDLRKGVAPVRLQRVMAEGVLLEAASGIRDYWGRRTVAGLLLMPASRHILTHLNEVLALKKKFR